MSDPTLPPGVTIADIEDDPNTINSDDAELERELEAADWKMDIEKDDLK